MLTLQSHIRHAEVLLIWKGQILRQLVYSMQIHKLSFCKKTCMYGPVTTWNLLTLLKFTCAGCLKFSRFGLKISEEITKFITWSCLSCLCSKSLELLYSCIHIRLISLLSTICITFENKTHKGISRPLSIAHNLDWFNGKIIIDFNRNTVW